VEEAPAGRRTVVFSGTAGQVASAFHTRMHSYRVNGETHLANATDPEIPAALAEVVQGLASLNDFHSRPALASADTSGSGQSLTPADLAAIYDVNALYSNSVDGTGTSIAIVARSNINLTDVQVFRSHMGLPANDPTIVVNGVDPGVLSGAEQTEATVDAEWSGAVAKKASIIVVVSASTITDGAALSAQYIVNHNVAPVMNASLGMCEATAGGSYAQFWNAIWQQAAAQGITVFVPSGDSGAAGCDPASASTSTGGQGVNAICSSPFSVCVGGTQFENVAGNGLALSYVPEAVWNSSGTVPGGSQLWSSGGGVSTVFPKPPWQTGTGTPAGSFRAVPDVALAASTNGGYSIVLNGGLDSIGGTSVASPCWAGLMALVVQRTATRQGNANPNLYGLFRIQAAGGAPVFHDITGGNNSVPGTAGFAAGAGYSQSTGLGTPDALFLIQHWTDTSGPWINSSLATSAVRVAAGSSASVNLNTAVGGGFSAAVAFTPVGLPTGLSAKFSPSVLAAPGLGSSTLTLSACASLSPGVYDVFVDASGGGLAQKVSMAITVTPSSHPGRARPTGTSASDREVRPAAETKGLSQNK
jgi:pseudomonalisin